jgi:hypothetical protein
MQKMKPLLHSRITMQLIDFKIDISFKKIRLPAMDILLVNYK